MNNKKWLLKFSVNKMFKKGIGFLAFIMVSFSLFCLPVMAEQDAEETPTTKMGGVIFEDLPINVYKNPEGIQTLANLPDSINLSVLDYFPPIGNQQLNSCVAWAEVYYQFTYEVAKLNGWDAKHDVSKIFSPKYAYTFLSQGLDEGLAKGSCLDFLEK